MCLYFLVPLKTFWADCIGCLVLGQPGSQMRPVCDWLAEAEPQPRSRDAKCLREPSSMDAAKIGVFHEPDSSGARHNMRVKNLDTCTEQPTNQ